MASAGAGFILLHPRDNQSIVYRVAIGAILYYFNSGSGATVVLPGGKELDVGESADAIDLMLR